MPAFTPVQKLVRADAVIVGKITAIEKDTVSASQYPGDPNKVDYKVAVIKVDVPILGADNLTHIKLGFIPPPPAAPGDPAVPPVRPGRGGLPPVNIAEGVEGLFYLTKHHSGSFYIINPIMAPTEAKAENYKKELELAKKGAAALADPIKALKSTQADDRLFAATVLINKYRTYPEAAQEVENVKIPVEESQLLLRAIAEGNWKTDTIDPNAPNAFMAFSLLGLNEKDGWRYPMVKPGEDFVEKTKEAFTQWLADAGKNYQITKIVKKK
ncbi:MAG: hypothetical protein RMJ56_04780, partial [Gemmataceae bacterium]|nr:hypothetical protein [Gemmata sp.]MDW8196904.1 hypothetical protein [Gemmataceae bacterium]